MKLSNKIKLVVSFLEQGGLVVTGKFTIGWDSDFEAPGIEVTKNGDKYLMQIDSDDVWTLLIKYARDITDQDSVQMAAHIAMSKRG